MDVDNEGPAPEDEQSGTASVSQGLETPDSINLKKEPYKSFSPTFYRTQGREAAVPGS